jgi:predicted transcriptional regulator of viral defense system
MNFLKFRNAFLDQLCFNTNQVFALDNLFDKNNLSRWLKKGYIIKLRNGFYTFPEHCNIADFNLFVANKIYKPSYVSLHSALSFYGIIPESVVQTTSVSSLKTCNFENSIGSFSYKNIKEQNFFGFRNLTFNGNKTILLATPEKAILDLLYLYPFYKTDDDFVDLRFDRQIISEVIDIGIFKDFLDKFKNKELEKRAELFFKLHDLN